MAALIRLVALAVWAVCAAAHARDAEDRLDRILAPHEGLPAVIEPGDLLRVTLRERGELRLEGSPPDLPWSWRRIEYGEWEASAPVPNSTAPGTYALTWRNGSRSDRVEAAVRVVTDATEYRMRIVHKPLFDSAPAVDAFFDGLTGGAELVWIWHARLGPDAAVHRRALERLRSGVSVVVLIPEPGDVGIPYWGTRPAHVPFGEDAFLVPPDGDRAHERVYRFRRDAIESRWNVVFLDETISRVNLRNRLTIFVDEPVSHVVLFDAAAGPRTPLSYPAQRIGIVPVASSPSVFAVGPRGIFPANAGANETPPNGE
jgi:hypothetical protein